MAEVKTGDRVRVHYTGRFTGGDVFDTSDGRAPLEFTAGGTEVIPGFSRGVIGMAPGGRRTVRIPPEDAYGHPDPNLIQRVGRDMVPESASAGDQFQATDGGGHEFPVTVREVTAKEVVLDANHPLAGQTLEFDLQLVEIIGG